MNILEEYWEVDGLSLHTWASAIETLSGRDGLPPRRGENQIVAYHAGAIWQKKVLDQRTLSIGMFVNNTDAEGAGGSRAQFNANLDALKRIFVDTSREVLITRRRRTLAGLLIQTGRAECIGVLEPAFFARDGAKVVFDLLMADPFWYGVEGVISFGPPGGNVSNPGDVPATKMKIRFNGPLTNPQLVNQSADDPAAVSYNGVIAGGSYVELDTYEYTARTNADVSVIGQITHSGAREWMALQPGINAMLLNVAAGAGTVDITFSPPYI